MKSKKITKEDILKLREKGFTLAEIARYYQVSRSTIYYIFNEERREKVKENTKKIS